MSESRTVAMVQEELKQAEEHLARIDAEIEGIHTTIRERQEALQEATKIQGQQKTLIANLRNDLSTLQQMRLIENGNDPDFDGCPKEWQREVIVFMRKQPGVPIHFTALITHVTQKMEMDAYTKMRAAMLNLMGHLITKKLVAKGKNGQYLWAVYPKDWKAPVPVLRIAPTKETKLDATREGIAEKLYKEILSYKEWIQKELESHFHRLCIDANASLPNPDDFKNDAQFIERYIYERAQKDTGSLSVYRKNEARRLGAEISTHLILARTRAHPGPEWELVVNPTVAQSRMDTKRKGGSVA
jgi:hypothetical protein